MNAEETLKRVHSSVCRVVFLVGLMLLRRKMSREAINESRTLLEQSVQDLDALSPTRERT